MSISVFKTFTTGEVLTASDLNSSFTQITSNGEDLGWPATKSKDLNGQELIFDSDADSSITVSTDDQFDFRIGGTDLIKLVDGIYTFTDKDAGTAIGPVLKLHRDSSTPAAADFISAVFLDGEDSAGNQQTYVSLEAQIDDPTSTSEDGTLLIKTQVAGTLTTQVDISSVLVNVTPPITTAGKLTDGASSTFTSGATIGNITLADGSITDSSGTISFNDENLTTSGTVTAGSVTLTTDLTVANGGTGASSFTDGGVLLGSGTGAITALRVLTGGEMIVGDGTTDPAIESGATLRTSIGLGAGNNVTFSDIAGTLTTAAQGNIASLGTLTTLTVDNITINGAVISSNTAAISFADENLTTTGTLTAGAATLASLTLTTDLPVTHGGTGVSTKTGTGNVVLSISPTLTGNPIAPTQSVNNNSTRIATTAFCVAQIADDAPTKTGGNASGSWNITAAIATTVTVADESTDTSCFPLFATAATGNLPPKSGTNLTFNSSSGLLTATLLAGAGSTITALNMANAGSGTLAVARGGTGVTAKTGTGNVVLSAGPTFTGTASFAVITATGDITGNTSDLRVKDRFESLHTNTLAQVVATPAFTYNNTKEVEEMSHGVIKSDVRQIGFGAQDIQRYWPEVVKPAPFDLDADGNSISGENYLTLQYEKLVPVLWQAVTDLHHELEKLKNDIR